MAEFDPQGPADKESKDQAAAYGQPRSQSCCNSGDSCEPDRADRDGRIDSFVSDWSGAEKTLEAQAAAFEASHSEPRKPDAFWVELVASQAPTQTIPVAASTELAAAPRESAVGVQSEQFWADLVRSQLSGSATSSTPTYGSLLTPPTGMGWSEDEASEWSAPEREHEPVQPAGEPVEAEASARRDDVEWGVPASDAQDWASARSEALHFEPSSSEPSLMSAAVDAAGQQAQPKAKKAIAKKPAAKKPAVKEAKTKKPAAKAKKPAAKKAAAKKPAVKKLVKKVAPAPKITKAPTRRAA